MGRVPRCVLRLFFLVRVVFLPSYQRTRSHLLVTILPFTQAKSTKTAAIDGKTVKPSPSKQTPCLLLAVSWTRTGADGSMCRDHDGLSMATRENKPGHLVPTVAH